MWLVVQEGVIPLEVMPAMARWWLRKGHIACAQVLRKRLSLVEPTIRTDGGFEYEEGEGLEEDEVSYTLDLHA